MLYYYVHGEHILMGVTQKDIARRLNLSQSLVVRCSATVPLMYGCLLRIGVWIHLTARELGYQPNSANMNVGHRQSLCRVLCRYVNSQGSWAGNYSAVIEVRAPKSWAAWITSSR